MKKLVPHSMETAPSPEPVERDPSQPALELGQWFWVKDTHRRYDAGSDDEIETPCEWLGCVMHIGSNYAQIQSPHSASGYRSVRVHLDNFWDTLRFEPNAAAVIQQNIEDHRAEAARLLGEVKALTARLGIVPQEMLPAPGSVPDQSTALATLSSRPDMSGYKLALVEAKDVTLPALFKAIKEENEELTSWMTAGTLPLQAMAERMKGSIAEVTDRIFNVSLYAGLTEEVVACCEGKPAAMTDKLHVMQRRLYMDEECLLDYRGGGMEFSDIRAFDDWITQPENRDRILPFPRTLVALRVRRTKKDREWDGSMLGAFINIQVADSDKYTFLYLRNGEQVWRLSADMDFGEMIFPDRALFDPTEPKMVKMFGNRVDKMITVSEYEALCADYEKVVALHTQWEKDHPGEWAALSPHMSGREARLRGVYFNPKDWAPFNQDNVHFDECMKQVETQVKEYNRIALIIQGLFDRSEVLHPHPPVRSWTPEGFAQAITLVYDGSQVLHNGAPPDFEAYRAQCNASLSADSLVTGQDDYWVARETEKECKRLDNDWRHRTSYRPTAHRPYGNPGPGIVAQPAQWKSRTREAVFAWYRKRLSQSYAYGAATSPIRATLSVPAGALFNVSAYTPGDFKQFFRDPRTRAQYLKWAPLLLTAEDYYAGKIAVQRPEEEPS